MQQNLAKWFTCAMLRVNIQIWLQRMWQGFVRLTATVNKLLTVSYLMSMRIAVAGKAHTIAENLFKSCILAAVSVVLNEASEEKRDWECSSVQQHSKLL
jgi:hypothetical protein